MTLTDWAMQQHYIMVVPGIGTGKTCLISDMARKFKADYMSDSELRDSDKLYVLMVTMPISISSVHNMS